jgi:multiple antibiotic resistance protein
MAALTIATLLPIINPPGGAPIFLSLTPGASDTTRSLLARRVGLDSFLLLSVAMLIGSHVLSFFGLSLPVVKIAGGLLVVANGWRLINADASTDSRPVDASAAWGAEEIARRAFYPLTFPLTVGPGSLSVAVTLGAGSHMSGVSLLTGMFGSLAGITIVSFIVFLSYRFAYDVVRRLGSTGTVILLRLSAFILLAIGVEIFCAGLSERFPVMGK